MDSFNLLLDKVQELAARQRRFLLDVAHELRTPLAIMRIRIEDLAAGEARTRLLLDLDRLGGRIDALLALARLRAGQQDAQIVDLVTVIRSIVMDRAPRAMAAGTDLGFDAPQATRVWADRGLIETVVTNLVDNAIAHSGPGASIMVRVLQPGTIEVVDDGAGIPDARRAERMQPFKRGNEAGQFGLGLALVSEAVDLMGSSLDLSQTPGGASLCAYVFLSQIQQEQCGVLKDHKLVHPRNSLPQNAVSGHRLKRMDFFRRGVDQGIVG